MEDKQLDLEIIELKSFVPAKNFNLSVRFYNDIGFSTTWSNDQLALLDYGGFKFLLQNFYVKDLAENFVMHLLVNNADDWWTKINDVTREKEYNIHLSSPENREWGLRDFVFSDPSGIMWRVGNSI